MAYVSDIRITKKARSSNVKRISIIVSIKTPKREKYPCKLFALPKKGVQIRS